MKIISDNSESFTKKDLNLFKINEISRKLRILNPKGRDVESKSTIIPQTEDFQRIDSADCSSEI